MKELSVIIPNFQTEERLLLACLSSIINRCENEIEIILIDDGSPKTYRETVYSKPIFCDETIKVIYQDNGGVSSARNRGLSEARGSYITFVDADDVIIGNFIRDGLRIARELNTDMIIGGLVDLGRYPEAEKTNYRLPISPADLKVFQHANEIVYLLLGKSYRFSDRIGYIGRGPVAKIIRTELARQISFREGLSIYEDTLWNMNVAKLINSACVVERIWYGYHNTIQSASKGYHPDEIERSTKGMNAIVEAIDLSDNKESKAFREQCIIEYLRILNTYFLNDSNDSNLVKKMKESQEMIHERPWNTVSRFCDLKGLSGRLKIYGILYILNAWIPLKLIKKRFFVRS